MKFKQFKKNLKDFITNNGIEQEDKRLNRNTQCFIACPVNVDDPEILEELKEKECLKKYDEDWVRIFPSLNKCCKLVMENKKSRQLMSFNDQDFFETFQCFTHFQFLNTEEDSFTLLVYQRSADLEKLYDDLIFFIKIAKHFEVMTKYKVPRISIIYGNIHYEKK